MTEPLPEVDQTPPQSISTIQCDLCLNEIVYNAEDPGIKEKVHVVCPKCDYRQPLSKTPRIRDVAIFGSAVACLYLATIVLVIATR